MDDKHRCRREYLPPVHWKREKQLQIFPPSFRHVAVSPTPTPSSLPPITARYAPPHPGGTWPLSANILDPVRLSLVADGPTHILRTASWFSDAALSARPCAAGMTVVRVKNGFGLGREDVVDGYRDLKLFVVFDGPVGLGIIGEIQVIPRYPHPWALRAPNRSITSITSLFTFCFLPSLFTRMCCTVHIGIILGTQHTELFHSYLLSAL
jgi:hypothetical protein